MSKKMLRNNYYLKSNPTEPVQVIKKALGRYKIRVPRADGFWEDIWVSAKKIIGID